MERFAVLILILFLYAGVTWLFSTVVTGTTAGDNIVNTYLPLVIGLVAVAFLVRLFR